MMTQKQSSKLKPGFVPLERALSKLGIASRTVARSWIQAGRVKVNGVIQTNSLFLVFPERTKIEIDEKKIEQAEWKVFLLNKPRGVVTTRSDEKGRKTVFSLLNESGLHLSAVGRLDFATSGLLILTNDTRLASWLTDPKTGISRVYVVSVRGEITEEKLQHLRKGVEEAGEILCPTAITLRKASKKESHLTVELKEGKNREIRRLFLAVGNEVTRLKRISYGGLNLGDLQPGQYRELTEEEVRKAFPLSPPCISIAKARRASKLL
jgi:23S rRNA pseudouridine2605 synthase